METVSNNSEAYFRQLLESGPDALVVVDDAGQIVLVNDQAEKLFQYTRDELVGESVELLIPASARARHTRHRDRYADNPTVRPMGVDLDLYARRSDGFEFPVEVSLSPIASAQGFLVSSVIRDVTRRKQLEAELIEARQIAERAHKANTAFLAAASHDLRQPVQALTLLNGALRRTVSDPLALEIIESQQYSLNAMTNLLNSLLDISRLDSGAVAPEIEDFPVQRLLDRLSPDIERQAQHRNLAFQTDANSSIIRSDPNLLSEMIQNLASNAIRYTDSGRVTLTCRTDDDRLSIDVRDTGIGIAAANQEEIFKEFHQLRQPGAGNEGFGLGLAIVRRLADLLNHEIIVESSPGEGSCFSIVVPIVEQAKATRPDNTRDAKSAGSTGGVILLIEDDLRVANAWAMMLKAEGCRVLQAQTASEAETLVRTSATIPDLIISDFHLLDDQTGVDAIARVRRLVNDELPAFIVSGDTTSIVDDAKQLTNCLLLRKPVHTDELLDLARKSMRDGWVP